jgi:hypothetical protein
MRQVRVWLDDKSAGSGFRVVLEVSRGTKYAHFLHVPTLTHIQMPVDELARQERRGMATEQRITRGLITRLEARMRLARRNKEQFPEVFCNEVLALIRQEKETGDGIHD